MTAEQLEAECKREIAAADQAITYWGVVLGSAQEALRDPRAPERSSYRQLRADEESARRVLDNFRTARRRLFSDLATLEKELYGYVKEGTQELFEEAKKQTPVDTLRKRAGEVLHRFQKTRRER